jgi:hypothetical protein
MDSNDMDLFQRILKQHTTIGELKDIESSEYKKIVKNAKTKAKEIITEIQRTNVNAYGNGWLYYVTDSIFNQLVFLRFLENIIKRGGHGEDYKIFKFSYYDPSAISISSLYDDDMTRDLNIKIDDRLNYLLEQYLLHEDFSISTETPIVLINYILSFIENNNILPLDINDDWYLDTKNNEKFLLLEEKFGPSPSTSLSSCKLMVRFNQDFRGGRKKRKTRIKRKRNKRKTKKNRFV